MFVNADHSGLLFQRHPQPMWVWSRRERRILVANEAAARCFGWPQEEFAHLRWTDLCEPGDAAILEAMLEDASAETSAIGEWVLHRRDGTRLSMELMQSPMPWGGETETRLVLALDVTEVRRTLAELTASEERFRLMVEGSEQVFFYTHDVDGRFQYVSPSVEAVLGHTPDELIGRHFAILDADEESGLHVRAATDEALRSGMAQPSMIARCRHRDGRTIPVEITERPVYRDGNVIGIQGFARDFSARQTLEQQLLQAQKLEAIGRLAGGIAHDFNNLLTVICSAAELLMDRTVETDPDRVDLLEISQAAARASTLTRQLLAFSRQQVLQPRILDLGSSVKGLHSMLSRLIGSHIELILEIDEHAPAVRADPGQIEQVFVNLVVNARDAMPDGGELRIRIRPHRIGRQPSASPDPSRGDYVAIEVIDAGHGIHPSQLPHLFEPFYTTKADRGGSGLGLATVYGIVNQSGGSVTVESTPGRGTVFRVLLPAASEIATALPEIHATPAVQQGNETILLVDDEPNVRSLVRRVLAKKGYSVLTAADANEAMAIAQTATPGIDLLITDMVMPKTSGLRVAELLRATDANLPVLFMSGHSQELILSGRNLRQTEAFIEKPFTGTDLARTVRALLDRRDLT